LKAICKKQIQKTFSNLGRNSGRIFNENNSGADGLRTKASCFLGVWLVSKSKKNP